MNRKAPAEETRQRDRAATVQRALRMIAADHRSWGQPHGTIPCPVCRAPLHYTISEALGKATGHCSRDGCLSVIGELPED
ncbi:MAG: hypothetical protein JWM41_2926 [Gemmatimonadetes bacterium]|nr:hypothetical protein [Gemmatimonadota bacterium]